MKKHLIAPSLLAADFTNLAKDIEMVNQSDADWFHLDVMDGQFVPNISFGMDIIRQIKTLAKKPLDVHLMIEQPERYIDAFWQAGADVITVHYETCPHLHRVIQMIKATGVKAGVAINPATNVSVLEDVIEDIDLALVMSVNPGFGGQKFIFRTLAKIRQMKALITKYQSNTLIEVDGGVGLQNAERILEAGANVLVSGSAIFKTENPTATISRMKSLGTLKWA